MSNVSAALNPSGVASIEPISTALDESIIQQINQRINQHNNHSIDKLINDRN